MKMRLQKYMARCGVASRRKCEEMIKKGLVVVNGELVRDMGVKIDPNRDIVYVEGKRIGMEENHVYIMLNKPRGYITTVKDQYNRPTVMDLIRGIPERIYPVGRLDYESEGLLLLTNDGKMAFYLTHPRYQIDKEYIVRVEGFPKTEDIDKLRRGIDIGGFVTSPAQVDVISRTKRTTLLKIIIREGKNRQVRRMFDAIGHTVVYLKRVRIGNIKLGNLEAGKWRYLTSKELEGLRDLILQNRTDRG